MRRVLLLVEVEAGEALLRQAAEQPLGLDGVPLLELLDVGLDVDERLALGREQLLDLLRDVLRVGSDGEGEVVALDANTGEVVWEVVNGDPSIGETNTATVLPVKDKVIVGTCLASSSSRISGST